MAERHSLTDLPRALIEAGYDATTYRALYTAAVDGRIATTKGKNGRWTFQADDLPAIAEAMGLADAPANVDAA